MFSWLKENGYMGSDNPTHYLMSGGSFKVPDENINTFLELYSKEVKSGNKNLTIAEIRSPISKMYFDIDLFDEPHVDENFIIKLASTIQDSIKEYYSKNDDIFQCIICTTPVKTVSKNDIEMKKYGIHIIFPNIIVDIEQIFKFHESSLRHIENKMGPLKRFNWTHAIDKAPYTGGLRMCGSFKSMKCKICKESRKNSLDEEKKTNKMIIRYRKKHFPREGKFNYKDINSLEQHELQNPTISGLMEKISNISTREICSSCINGKYLEDKTYMPVLALDSSGKIDTKMTDHILTDTHKAIILSSIRHIY